MLVNYSFSVYSRSSTRLASSCPSLSLLCLKDFKKVSHLKALLKTFQHLSYPQIHTRTQLPRVLWFLPSLMHVNGESEF